MKKIINVLTFLLAVLIAASCEKYIEFSGEESEPRLTVSALAKAGEPFRAYVSSSLFFLDSDGIEAFVKDLDVSRGVVQVTVNGESGPVAMRCMPEKVDGALLYGCDYVPRPGDRIVLEAEFPGFDPVRAETRVPYPPRFEITSLKPGSAEEDMEMTIRLSDDGSYEKYYFLAPKRVMPSPWTEEPAEVFCRFNSDDIVFRNVAMGVFEIYGFIFGDDDLVSCYFSDRLIRGQEHSMKLVFPGVRLAEGDRFSVELRTVTESLYWFDTSFAQMRSDFNIFAEGVTLYSNVTGGYGVLCASASARIDVEL